MSIGVDEVVGASGVRAIGRSRRAEVPVRRARDEVLRRPPGGARVVRRVAPRPRACLVERPRMRLRMLVVAAVAVFAVIAFSGAVIAQLAGGMAAEVPDRTTVVAVAKGESLWEVASRYAPGSDPRAVVERIEQLNEVKAGSLPAGATLVVPVESERG